MLDYKPTLVEELSELGLPVLYELFLDSSTQIPCITFVESSDVSHKEGDTLRYSRKTYTIKIWGEDIAEMTNYYSLLDIKMKQLGFTRLSYAELKYDVRLCMIITYQGLALENYGG